MNIRNEFRRRQQRLLYSIAAVAVSLSIAGPTKAETPATSVAGAQVAFAPTDVQEVVVTARRRNEKAQDVPIPITVLGGDALTEEGVHRLEDIQQKLPSVNVSVLNPRQNSIAIRGLGNNPANDGLESSTGVFLDGVYLGRPGMAIFDLVDLDQFELLRGPQGTLFGKNTTAGALNITTKAPSFTPGATAEVTLGNYLDHEFRGTVTGPILEDKIAARITAYSVERDGFLANLTNGARNNGQARQGVRAQLLFKPADDLTIRLIGEYNREHDPNEASNYYNAPGNNAYFPFLRSLQAHGYNILTPSTKRYTYNDYFNDLQTISVQQGGLSGQADWDFGDGYRLTSITGYRLWNFSPHNDADATNLSLLEAGVQNHDSQFSEELRVASPKEGPIDYTAGLYFFSQAQQTHQYAEYTKSAATILAFGPLNNGKDVTVDSRLRTRSYAAFGQANWHATDDLTITLGARNTLEQKTMAIYRNLAHTVANPLVPNIDSAAVSPKANNVSSTLQTDYKLTPEISLFASYAHGAKAGATNNSPPNSVPLGRAPLIVQPEKADDGEIGFKSQLFDRQLTLNGNAFYTLVRNYQATSFFIDPSNPALAGSVLTNVGAVRTEGAELEASIRPLEGLRLTLTGSYNNATYRSFRAGPCAAEYGLAASATCDLTGRSVVGAPKWIGSFIADYHRDLSDDIIGYAIADVSVRSSFYGLIDDSAYSRIAGYGIANLRLGVKFDDEKYDASFFVKNLTDTQYFPTLSISTTRGAYFGFLGDPLTFGATVRVTF